MKTNRKTVEQLGGHNTEDGGCIFSYEDDQENTERIDLSGDEMPTTVEKLVSKLLTRAYFKGVQEGKERLQTTMRNILGVK